MSTDCDAEFGQEDLVRIRPYATLAEPQRQGLPQGRETERRVVADPSRRVWIARRPAEAPGQALVRHPGRGKPSRTGLQHARGRVERLPRQPQGIDGAVETRAQGLERERPGRTRHVEARSAPRHDRTLRDQPVIGFDDRGFRHVHLGRKIPYGRKLGAGDEFAGVDPCRDARHDGFDPGPGAKAMRRLIEHLYGSFEGTV